VLAMLATLRVAPGGSAPPIPCVARRGEALPSTGCGFLKAVEFGRKSPWS
jgi:hypothetical protein